MYDQSFIYIVTGCTGYVGNVLAKSIIEGGCRVIGLARDEKKVKQVYKGNAPKIVYGDINSKEDVSRLFEGEGPFVVIHTVAMISIGEVPFKELVKVNVEGTKNLLRECRRHQVRKFIHISSSEAIPEGVKLKDDLSNLVPDPNKCKPKYAKSKAMADIAVLKEVEEHGLDASIIHLAGVLGPGDYSNSHMTQMMIEFAKGKLPASVKGGYNDFDIRDVAEVFDKVINLSKKGEHYIFANRPDQINEVLSYVSKATGAKMKPTLPLWIAYLGLPFLWVGNKLSGKRPLYTSSALHALKADCDFPLKKVKDEFGYSPRSLEETVIDHMAFLKEEGLMS